ncbi:MAG: acetate/propionate family kinase [Planctomycetota bacterium]|jgi:acetate kinase
MKILVVNAGSSSLKCAVIDPDVTAELAEGLVERIGLEGTRLKASAGERRSERACPEVADAADALGCLVRELVTGPTAVLGSLDQVDAVGHRLVHGGDVYSDSVVIDDAVIETARELSALAPLHNPANLAGIEAARALLPDRPHVAVFDTAFHATIPPRAHLYGLPIELAREHRLRRYGFHGTSHKYVSGRAIEMLGWPAHSRIVTAHVGNGVSLCAVLDGKSVDTTMGMTPLEGVMMGTRSGSVDPGIVLYLIEKLGLPVGEVDRLLNKESGIYGLAGVGSGDLRDIEAAIDSGNETARTAYDAYLYRLALAVGTMAAALGGIDAVAFTAGAGEKSPELREAVCARLGFLGVVLDPQKNATAAPDCDVSASNARARTFVIATQEDLIIARETARVVASAGT